MSKKHINNARFVYFIVLISLLNVFGSCAQRKINYDAFSQNSVLKANLIDGRELYFIRTSSSDILYGTLFINDKKALVNTCIFVADHAGNFTLNDKNINYNGSLKINKDAKSFRANFPNIAELNIKKQKVNFELFDFTNVDFDCKQRYKENIFDSLTVSKDIHYGTVTGYYTSKVLDSIPNGDYSTVMKDVFQEIKNSLKGREQLDLHMDIYAPSGDSVKKRPVFLYIHGGAFVFGDKENPLQMKLTEDLVKKGYVLVSINYRLGTAFVGRRAIERAVYRGIQDSRLALKHLIENADDYGIDTNQIYLSGSSAGAIIALASAFMDENNMFKSVVRRMNRDDLGELEIVEDSIDFNIAGVVSMWGGTFNTDIIKPDTKIPLIFFHGTDDNIVPIDSGLPFQETIGRIEDFVFRDWKLYGSQTLYRHMSANHKDVKLIKFVGYGHEPHLDKETGAFNQNMETILTETNEFIYNNLSKQLFDYSIVGKTEITPTDILPVYELTGLEPHHLIDWHIENGYILSKNHNEITAVWFNNEKSTGKIKACVYDEKGISSVKELNVELKK